MKLFRSSLIGAALICASPVAMSQVFVIGGGYGAQCYEATKNANSSFTASEALCDKALSEDAMTRGNRAGTHVNRGILRMRHGEYDKSLQDFDRAIQLQPDMGEAYLNKGAALIYKRDYATAIPVLDKSIALESSRLYAAYYNRAIARENNGDVPGAFFDFKKSLELRPDWDLAEMQLSRFKVDSVDG